MTGREPVSDAIAGFLIGAAVVIGCLVLAAVILGAWVIFG